MPRIPLTARLAESTVQAADQHTNSYPDTTTPRSTRVRRHGEVIHISVDPEVWAVAVSLAEQDPARLEIRDTTTVVVHNSPGWRRRVLRR